MSLPSYAAAVGANIDSKNPYEVLGVGQGADKKRSKKHTVS